MNWLEIYSKLLKFETTFGNEAECVHWVEELLQSWGYQPERIYHEKENLRGLKGAQGPFLSKSDRFSIALRVPARGGDPRPPLILNAHLDVVEALNLEDWKSPPFEPHIEDGKMFARGAMDDKAGVSIILSLLDILRKNQEKPHRSIIVHLVLEDEKTGNGSLLCLEKGFSAPACIILDGTRKGQAIQRHATNLAFSVRLKGDPVSVAVSHLTKNPAHVLSALVLRLVDFCEQKNQKPDLGGYEVYPHSNKITVTSFKTEPGALTTPGSAECSFYATLTPGESLGEHRKSFESVGLKLQEELKLARPLEWNWDQFASETTEPLDLQAQKNLQNEISSAFDMPIQMLPSTGTSDLRHFFARKIAACLYGPGDGGNPHRPNEFFPLADLRIMVKGFYNLVSSDQGNVVDKYFDLA